MYISITGSVRLLYENGAIDNTLAKMKELGYTYEADGATYMQVTLKMIKTVY